MRRLVAQLTALIAVTVMAVSASADDALIAKQIIAKLSQQKQAANLKGFDLGVQVDNGTVTMMGQVASSQQAMLALDVARRTPGVKLVVNDLYVSQRYTPAQAQSVVAVPQPVQLAMAQQQAAPIPAARIPAAQYPQPVSHAVSAVSPIQRPQPIAGSSVLARQPQTPVAFAHSTIPGGRQTVAPANYVEGYEGDIVGGGAYGGGIVSDNPSVPGYAWPSYAASPNYGAVAYPQQYSATAWPYIGPFYPYPQVPLGWRKVSLEWDDGWWFLDFTKK